MADDENPGLGGRDRFDVRHDLAAVREKGSYGDSAPNSEWRMSDLNVPSLQFRRAPAVNAIRCCDHNCH